MKLYIRAHDLGVKGEEKVAVRLRELGLAGVQLVAYKILEDVPYRPGAITEERAEQLGRFFREQGVEVPLIGAYFNPVHPDAAKAEKGERIFKEYLAQAARLGCAYVGSETGSYNGDPWIYRPENRTEEAYARVAEVFGRLADYAAEQGVSIAMEGAAGHVCYCPDVLYETVRRMNRPNVRFIFDLFNYLDDQNYEKRYEILDRGLELFGKDILVYHIKDFTVEDGHIRQVGVGRGLMDFDRILGAICRVDPDAKLVLEGTVGDDIPFAVQTINTALGHLKKEETTMTLDTRYANHPDDSRYYDTEALRENYLIEKVFVPDEISLTYSHQDRIIAGGAMPVNGPLVLGTMKELATDYFLERREMGIINIGGAGNVRLDGKDYPLNHKEGLYIGMGTKEIIFSSDDAAAPAKFYINSCPAHHSYPTVHITKDKARHVPCGDEAHLNKRVINQFVHPAVCQSCQLCMGMTELDPTACWNTMPCHTHERRMEVYLYFDLHDDNIVFHMMGQPDETRHIIMHNEQAVISPSWSIHSGVGTSNYTFIWGMCGENQTFDDMDHVATLDLK